ncbi:uncharacterized protein LOC144878654 [Branchiostoma floridae x Branchiostoma japonicum]
MIFKLKKIKTDLQHPRQKWSVSLRHRRSRYRTILFLLDAIFFLHSNRKFVSFLLVFSSFLSAMDGEVPQFYVEEVSERDLDALLRPWEAETEPEQQPEPEGAAENTTARFATLDGEQLDEIEGGRVEKTTEKSTRWGVKIFKAWLQERDHDTAFEQLPPEELAGLLRQFYGEVRKDDGTPYAKASYACLRAAIHRHLTGPPYHCKYNILKDKEFQAANNLYIGVLKQLKRDGKDTCKSYPPILASDLRKMFETKILSVDNPLALQRLVYFYLAYYLCRRGRENLRNFQKNDFVAHMDGGKKYYTLKYNEHQKNHPGHLSGDAQPTQRLYASPNNTRPCPVQVFELYCSKLKNSCPYLFQRPNLQWKPETNAEWYYGQPLGHNKLGSMMRDISRAAGLSKPYTNHSVRVTAIQALDQAGFEARVIMSISGHRNESSIRKYTHDSTDKQKKDCSSALGAALDVDSPNTCAPGEENASCSLQSVPRPAGIDTRAPGERNDSGSLQSVPRQTGIDTRAPEGNASCSLQSVPRPAGIDTRAPGERNDSGSLQSVPRQTGIDTRAPGERNASYSLQSMAQLFGGQVHFNGPVAFNFK